ncbi:MAG: hypothetical protein M3321_02815 [Actinomycetota bacterium]|nr:hypothetical protein [Actinomycetota bacterium]
MGRQPSTILEIPTRFESVLERPDLRPAPLILPVEDDLRLFARLRRMASMQRAGVLAFLLGRSGVGKTTAVYSAATHMPDDFGPVVAVPAALSTRDLVDWLGAELPEATGKAVPLLFDGREVTDDDVGLAQFVAALNQVLRRRADVLAIWPTTDGAWHAKLREVAERIGGETLSPTDADLEIAGPPRTEWPAALDRLLMQMDRTLADLAIEEDTVGQIVADAANIGDFLRRVGLVMVDRVEDVQVARVLPSLLFVVTSTSEVVGEADRLRRAGTLVLRAEELLRYSPRSRAGLWWIARNLDPRHHLGYIITLFRARLASMTPSSVVYACAEFDDSLRTVVRSAGVARSSSNADRTIKNTDFYRLMIGEPPSELTSTRKGRTALTTLAAYRALQELSSTRHISINRAICRLMARNVPGFDLDNAAFEVDQGDGEIYTDVVVPTADGTEYLEFHHAADPRAAAIAAYIMTKLQYYAIRYNLVPR